MVSHILPAVIVLALAVTATAQPPVSGLKDDLAEYKKLIKDRKGTHDKRAKAIIDKWLPKFDKLKAGEKKAFAAGIGFSLTSKRTRKPANDDIFRVTIRALGHTGKFGSEALIDGFKNKKFGKKPWINLRGAMLEALGATKDERNIKFLLKVARNGHVPEFLAKAGGTLRHFEKSKLATRKEICKDLIPKFGKIQSDVNSKASHLDRSSHILLAAISDPWNNTLRKLTRKNHVGAEKWQWFLNKEKENNWDAKPKKTRRKKQKGKKTK